MTGRLRAGLVPGFAIVLTALALISLEVGRVPIPPSSWFDAADPRQAILLGLRAPRTLLALLVGAALGLSGAAMQGYTRNPLADPGTLGVSSMAALGAVMSLFLGGSSVWAAPVAAMVGALAGIAGLISLSGAASGMTAFVLAGMALNTVASAGVALALSLAPNPWAVGEIVNWLMGSLNDRSLDDLTLAAPFILSGCGVLLFLGRDLDALTLGETGAKSVGVDLPRLRRRLTLGVGLATGAAVAVTGVIGFVGLLTPHLLRPFAGERPGGLLAPSTLVGALIVLCADIAVRSLPAAAEVRLGVVMAAVGGPVFLLQLVRMRRRLG